MEGRYCFYNDAGQYIQLQFSHSLPKQVRLDDVLVICRYRQKWLLTNHKKRGYEFPGGKIAINELAEQAVRREVFEETGGIIDNVRYIGFYRVHSNEDCFHKGIYFANIKKIERKTDYLETNGPILIDHLCADVVKHRSFSFIMQDDVLIRSLEYLQNNRMYEGGEMR